MEEAWIMDGTDLSWSWVTEKIINLATGRQHQSSHRFIGILVLKLHGSGSDGLYLGIIEF